VGENAMKIKKKALPKNLHPNVLKPKKDHPLFIEEVLKWLEFNKQQAGQYRSLARRGNKEATAKRYIHEGYAKDINHYLRYGDWISDFFGANQEHKIFWKSR
jgi:hypothetical protein